MIEVAHETILSSWEPLQQWILIHAEALRARRDLEHVASEWDKSGRPGSALRTGKLLLRYLDAAAPRSITADAYLTACKHRRTGFRVAFSALGLLSILTLGILFHVNKSQYPPSLAAKALFVELDLWPVPQPEMVVIPAGQFEMGTLSGDNAGSDDERPVHTVRFATAFEMGQYEVTFDEYDLFAAATGRDKPADQGWGRGKRPVINVSWDDALAYTQWLSERTGLNYRLPLEAEWEYAARATTMTMRYWPEKPESEPEAACMYANVFDAKNASVIKNTYSGISYEPFNCPDEFPFTAPVGKFLANDWGLHDMLGNVWEWTQDCYLENYADFQRMGRRENLIIQEIVLSVCCAAGRGAMAHGACARPTVTGTRPTAAASRSVFGSPGPFNFFLFSFSLLGVWGQSPHRKFF
jgi:formylglycine-generating enzyme required for sulfatase activity